MRSGRAVKAVGFAAATKSAGAASAPFARPGSGFVRRAALSVLPALGGHVSRLIVMLVSVTSGDPSLVVPSGGGFYGAEIPGVSLGTAEHKALSTTATRWASALLGHPPSTLAASYSAARQYAPGVSDLFALCPLAGALPLSEPARLATPRWASLESLRGTSEYVGSAVMAYRAATYFTPIDLLGASASPLDVADVAVADAALSTAGSYRVGSLVPTALKEAQSKGFRREAHITIPTVQRLR